MTICFLIDTVGSIKAQPTQLLLVVYQTDYNNKQLTLTLTTIETLEVLEVN